jgi:hypothetical protein
MPVMFHVQMFFIKINKHFEVEKIGFATYCSIHHWPF